MISSEKWVKMFGKLQKLGFGIFFLFFFFTIGIAEEMIDGIAAMVNGDIITIGELRAFLGPTEDSLQKIYGNNEPKLVEELKKARKAAVDQLIDQRLIIQQFNVLESKNSAKIVTDEWIEKEIQNDINQYYGRDRSIFIKTLEANGLNLEAYKERVRDKIIVSAMRYNEIGGEKILISPYKIETYYKDHPDEFKEGEKIKLRMLYIRKGESPDEIEGARSLTQEILIKLTTGSDFSSLATVYSEGSEKNQGGQLGFVDRETLREELREPAFSLDAGQISKMIDTKDGFYILQVDEKKPATVTTLEEARDLIEHLLEGQEKERLQKRWLQNLRRKAYIRVY